MSDRLLLDLVRDDLVSCAWACGEISVLSDGTPWRPLIDVTDMARAIEWATGREAATGGPVLSVNVGANGWNHQVKDLPAAVADAVPTTRVRVNTAAAPDRRSYRVGCSLYARLAPAHQPRSSLAQSIARLRDGLGRMGFADPEFRGSSLIRLKVQERLIAAGQLTPDLRWATGQAAAA